MYEKVRAKFAVAEVTKLSPTYGKVKLQPQYDQSIPEDVRFAKATPNGSLEMYIDNPPAFEFFEIGKAFYLDFTKAEEVKA